MSSFVDIHTHSHRYNENIISVFSLRVGVDDDFPPHYPFSFGIHPWDAGTIDFNKVEMDRLLKYQPVAVGEIGLDFLHNHNTRNTQISLFRQQLEFAQQHQLPVIIHSVRTLHDVLKILKLYPSLTAIFHGFIGNRMQAANILTLGHSISLGPAALRSPKTLDALTVIPYKYLFLESDNSLSDIRILYASIASKLGVSTEFLCNQLYLNYSNIFNIHGNP